MNMTSARHQRPAQEAPPLPTPSSPPQTRWPREPGVPHRPLPGMPVGELWAKLWPTGSVGTRLWSGRGASAVGGPRTVEPFPPWACLTWDPLPLQPQEPVVSLAKAVLISPVRLTSVLTKRGQLLVHHLKALITRTESYLKSALLSLLPVPVFH